MKAKHLKTLIATIPDEAEVFSSVCDGYVEDWFKEELNMQPYFHEETEEQIYVLSGHQPRGYINKDELDKKRKWKTIRNSFIPRKNWTIEDSPWGVNKRATLKFKVERFGYSFGIYMGREKTIRSYVDPSKEEEFDSWDEFFAAAEPIIFKAAQKQREELENLLEK